MTLIPKGKIQQEMPLRNGLSKFTDWLASNVSRLLDVQLPEPPPTLTALSKLFLKFAHLV